MSRIRALKDFFLKQRLGEREQKLLDISYRDSAERAAAFSFVLAVMFSVYGFTSIDFIRRFDSSVTTWDNVWPRLLFNAIPLALLGFYTKWTTASPRRRVLIWIGVFSCILHAAAWIHIWPIALRGNPGILAYVNGANTPLFAFVFVVVSPPTSVLPAFFGLLMCLFVLPLFGVSIATQDLTIRSLIINDSLTALAAGLCSSAVFHGLRSKLALLELEKTERISKFVGSTVAKAIFEDRSDLLERRTKVGFILAMDVRGYTKLVQSNASGQVSEFIREYHAIVSRLVSQAGGFIHKTSGDGHLISFGIMNEEADLSDIPGIEAEVAAADARRRSRMMDEALKCFERIDFETNQLKVRFKLTVNISIGAAIDFGSIEVGLFGDNNRQELDIFGETIIRATRLEAYTKTVIAKLGVKGSLVVVSPDAGTYLNGHTDMTSWDTSADPVKDYPQLNKLWLLQLAPMETVATAA